MGRLADLRGRQEDWGIKDSRRLASLRLDQEYRDSLEPESQPKQSTIESPEVASLRREVRIQGELLESVRTTVSYIQKRKEGDY